MKVNGYQLREAIKEHELRSETAASSFDGSLKKFPHEEKQNPSTIVDQFLDAERSIAKLQTAQMKYNLSVRIVFDGETITLAEGIKRVGGEGKAEKMWRSAASPRKDKYGYHPDENEIDPTRVRSVPTVTTSEAVKYASHAAKRAGALRAAIAGANTQPVEIEDLSPTLFE